MNLEFQTKQVQVITTLPTLFVDMLRLMYRDVQFHAASISNWCQLKGEILLLNAPTGASWIRHRPSSAQSIIIWGRVPVGLKLKSFTYCQIIPCADAGAELWSKFQTFLDNFKSITLNSHFRPIILSWLNQDMVSYVKAFLKMARNEFPVPKLPEYNQSDWQNLCYSESSLYIHFGIRRIVASSRLGFNSSELTALLCLPFDQIKAIGRQEYVRELNQMLPWAIPDLHNEREFHVGGRVYRCLQTSSAVLHRDALIIFGRNPRIEVIITPIVANRVKMHIRPAAHGLYGEVMDELTFTLRKALKYRNKAIFPDIILRESRFASLSPQLVACKPFAEQDQDDEPRFRESIQSILCELTMSKTPPDERFSVEDVFKMTVARLKTTQTIHYSQLDFVMECVEKHFGEKKDPHQPDVEPI